MLNFLYEFNYDEIMELVGKQKKIKINIKSEEFSVNLNSQRLLLFKKSNTCCCCGIEGRIIRLERHGTEAPHLNLYAIKDNKTILMTKDHIIPKSKKGTNYMSNYQTMCIICNNIKGNNDLSNDQIKFLNEKYYKNIQSSRTHKNTFNIIDDKISGILNDSKGNIRA